MAYLGHTALTTVALLLPGYVMLTLLDRRRSPLDRICLAAPVTLAVVSTLVVVTNTTSFPATPVTLGIWFVGAAVLAAVAGRRPIRAAPSTTHVQKQPTRVGLALVGTAMLVGLSIWGIALHHSEGKLPPGIDAPRHTFFMARIADTDHTDTTAVTPTDLVHGEAAARFYPLTAHVLAAEVNRVTGVGFAALYEGLVVASSAIVLPLGMWALARRLNHSELTSGIAAVLATALPLFPFDAFIFGGFALILGVALLPAAIVLLVDALTDSRRVLGRTLGVGAVLALFGVHTSELPLLIVAAAAIALQLAVPIRTIVTRAAVILIAAGVVMAPLIVGLLADSSLRTGYDSSSTASVASDLYDTIWLHSSVTKTLLPAVALAGGILLCRRRQWAIPATFVVFLFAAFVAARTNVATLAGRATAPWYGDSARVLSDAALLIPLMAAPVVSAAFRWGRESFESRPIFQGACVSVAFLLLMPGALNDSTTAQTGYLNAVVGPDQEQAYRYLAAHVDARHTVVSEPYADGSLWMYSEVGVRPVLALAPGPERNAASLSQNWRAGLDLVLGVNRVDDDSQVRSIASTYCSSYVLFNELEVPSFPHYMGLDSLRASSALEEVFTAGPAHVFAIRNPPACGAQ